MRDHRAVYRGYAIYISGADSSWSFHAEPIHADLPILPQAKFQGHPNWGEALRKCEKRDRRSEA
jgi:hypothetical protein